MIKQFFISILLIITKTCLSQNLVPNPSFESFTTCPNFASQVTYATNWHDVLSTPDYFNVCAPYGWSSIPLNYFGSAMPLTGNAYAGFGGSGGNFPEGLGTTLITPLLAGTKYFISFNVFLAQRANLNQWAGINKIGALFSTVQYNSSNQAPLCNCSQFFTNTVITDTTQWTKVSGSFIAAANYSYMAIGRFFTDALTTSIQLMGTQSNSYYYLDDVCLSDDSLYTSSWSGTTGINNFKEQTSVTCFPNPFTDKLNFNLENNEASEIILHDLTSREVLKQAFIMSVSLDTKQLDKRTYFYEIKSKTGLAKTGVVIKEQKCLQFLYQQSYLQTLT